jgi:hypothetical protein
MLAYHHSIALLLIAMLTVVSVQAAEPREPRLKFRGKGPVCSCATGMGEEDIRKAWEARFAQPEINRPESSDRRTTPSDEQRREIDELQAK